MMVNMNGLSYGTWRNIQKAIEQFDVPVKSAGNYLLKLQEVFTPGHTRQIHVLPKLGEGSLGDAAEYQRVSVPISPNQRSKSLLTRLDGMNNIASSTGCQQISRKRRNYKNSSL